MKQKAQLKLAQQGKRRREEGEQVLLLYEIKIAVVVIVVDGIEPQRSQHIDDINIPGPWSTIEPSAKETAQYRKERRWFSEQPVQRQRQLCARNQEGQALLHL